MREKDNRHKTPEADNCQQVQAFVSAYFDNTLTDAEALAVKQHLSLCSGCQSIFQQASSVQSALSTLSNTETDALPDLWQAVSLQLDADIEASAPCLYNAEFVSAYLDQEIPEVSLLNTFESHLPACEPCTTLLGELQSASDQVRFWAMAEERHCDIDLTATVMAAVGNPDTPLQTCDTVSPETLSAFYDTSLSAAETLFVSKHLDACEPCKQQLSAFCSVSESFGTYIEDSQAQLASLSVWPAIQGQVAETLRQEKSPVLAGVIPLPFKRMASLRYAMPTSAVAAVLLLVTVGGHFLQDTMFYGSMPFQPIPLRGDRGEIASLPQSSSNRWLQESSEEEASTASHISFPQSNASQATVSSDNAASSVAENQLASNIPAADTDASFETPCAEAYLLSTCNREMPGEGDSVALGMAENSV